MNIEGLDYNTQRNKLLLPEYGRELQNMVDYCTNLTDRGERQRCAETIIAIMSRMFPQNREAGDLKQKLWDNLAIMSNFKLDIDWPVDISEAKVISKRPAPMDYPMEKIPVKHYGKMIFGLFEKLKTMEPGAERDELIALTANQMKRNLYQWSHGSADNEKVASDLANYTDDKVQLDLDRFTFEKIVPRTEDNGKKKKRK